MKLSYLFFLVTNHHQKNHHYDVQVVWLNTWMHFKLFHMFQNAECFITASTVYLKNVRQILHIQTSDVNETEVWTSLSWCLISNMKLSSEGNFVQQMQHSLPS